MYVFFTFMNNDEKKFTPLAFPRTYDRGAIYSSGNLK